jgi:hypothetical protein
MESSTINCDRESVSRLACKTGRIHNTGGMGKKTLEAHIGLCKGLARSSCRSSNEHSRSMVQQSNHHEICMLSRSNSGPTARKHLHDRNSQRCQTHLNTSDAVAQPFEHVSSTGYT